MSRPYVPIPVEAARQIAVRHEKEVVVIIAIDALHDKTHTTTYGRSPLAKDYAAALGQKIAEFVTGSPAREKFQDYADPSDAAVTARKLEDLAQLARDFPGRDCTVQEAAAWTARRDALLAAAPPAAESSGAR